MGTMGHDPSGARRRSSAWHAGAWDHLVLVLGDQPTAGEVAERLSAYPRVVVENLHSDEEFGAVVGRFESPPIVVAVVACESQGTRLADWIAEHRRLTGFVSWNPKDAERAHGELKRIVDRVERLDRSARMLARGARLDDMPGRVMRAFARGIPRRDLAKFFGRSDSTIKGHVAQVLRHYAITQLADLWPMLLVHADDMNGARLEKDDSGQ